MTTTLPEVFDPATTKSMSGNPLLSPGSYLVTCSKIEVTERQGNYDVSCMWEIKDAQTPECKAFVGHSYTDRIAYINGHELVQKIGRSQLKSLFDLFGMPQGQDVSPLQGKTVVMSAVNKPDKKDPTKIYTNIQKYSLPQSGQSAPPTPAPAPQPQPAPQPTQAPPAAQTSAAPW